jgi:two-component system, OmpR family, sensor histidine kinase KdpD
VSGPRASASTLLRRRPAAVGAAIAVIAATLAVATALRPVELTEILLVVLVEVLAVSLVAGRAVAALTAVAAGIAVNWLLVPPYGTLVMANPRNWVTLAVFLLLAVGASTLVEAVAASDRQAAAAAAREAAVAEVLTPQDPSATEALGALCAALHLDAASISATGAHDALTWGTPPGPAHPPTVDVSVARGFRVLGWGPPVLGAQPAYVSSLATAAVRAWESERLVAEQERSARLAEIDSARAALLASIGHDLRTPLTGIRVSADALALSGDTLAPADREELIESLRQSAVRLDGLLDSVLHAARIEAGSESVHPAPCDLREVVARAVADLRSDRLRVSADGRAVMATVDPVICERVVGNLVSNALGHTPEDSPVEVRTATEGSRAAITVVDHGQGLADAIDTGRNRHGLGLTIVDRLARYAGIEVAQQETPGGGLTVTLRLPGTTAATPVPAGGSAPGAQR